MAKKLTVSQANKKMKQLGLEADQHKTASKRALKYGLLMLLLFVLLVFLQQTLLRLGLFAGREEISGAVTLGFLALTAFISVHFWIGYARENRQYKECSKAIGYYQEQIGGIKKQ